MALIASAIPVAPQSLYEVLGVLAFLLLTATQVRSWFARVPQPMRTKEDVDYVDRESYHVHCRLNREAHDRIEGKLTTEIKGIERSHNALAREVSAVAENARASAARLVQMDRKLDQIIAQNAQRQ